MKTVSKENSVVRSGIVKTTKCGIVVNAKAFEMLARQYSDPVKAIIQEIGANAADSHIRAGKEDVPFSVKLPNALDPHLRIRDYGVGMSKDVIYDVYINYMQSDKTGTNAETGCFGIGSKTPLAYSDQFNITTYNSGVMTMYALVKNEEGVPELNEFGDHETDEEDGVEISFSIKEDDFDRFAQRAFSVYSFFNCRPTITGNTSYEYKEEKEVILQGDDWKLYGGYGTAYAVMGNIAYPIDEDQFDWQTKYRKFLSNDSRIEIPIGELNITPSREALEYTEHTIKGLKKAVDKIIDEVDIQVGKEMSECNSWWQAKLLSDKIEGRIHGVPDLSSLETFEGVSLKYNPKLKIKRVYRIDRKVKASNYDCRETTVHANKEVRVVIQDEGRGFDKKCRYFCGENDVRVYLVSDDAANEHGGVSGIMDILGVVEEDNVVSLVSDLPTPPKTENPNKGISYGTRKKTTSVRIFTPEGNCSYGKRYEARWWGNSEVDIKNDKDKKLYVCWFNYDTTTMDGSSVSVKRLLQCLTELGIKVPPIYGLKENQAKTASKQSHWKCFHEWALLALKDFLSKNEGWEDNLRLDKISDHHCWVDDLSKVVDKYNVVIENVDSPLAKLVDSFKGREVASFTTNVKAIAREVNYKLDYEKEDSSLDKLIGDVAKKYPFLVTLCSEYFIKRMEDKEAENLFKMVNALDRS